ncbi:hypothetical protein ACIQVO_09945 [Streptomyces sp. NPDC101062]|uniref:hypothetical protein n=1 Tax=unclassified Streptomyces TaxID=2593676 RepID=UPI0037FE6BAB
MNDAVVWLVLSTSVLLVVLNLGIGVLALWSHRAGLSVTERLITSGELDVYHATWLTRCGYGRTSTATWFRERVASELALRSLTTAGLVHIDARQALIPPPDATEHTDETVAPDHPLTREAWRFVRDSWAAGQPVTVRGLAGHPVFKEACAAHRGRLAGHLPLRRIRLDNHAECAPRAAGWTATGWITLNTCVLMGWHTFGPPGAGPDGMFEKAFAIFALAVGTVFLAALLLVTLHVLIWQAWQDRWPRRLRAHCEALLQRESGTWIPLSQLPVA